MRWRGGRGRGAKRPAFAPSDAAGARSAPLRLPKREDGEGGAKRRLPLPQSGARGCVERLTVCLMGSVLQWHYALVWRRIGRNGRPSASRAASNVTVAVPRLRGTATAHHPLPPFSWQGSSGKQLAGTRTRDAPFGRRGRLVPEGGGGPVGVVARRLLPAALVVLALRLADLGGAGRAGVSRGAADGSARGWLSPICFDVCLRVVLLRGHGLE